MDITEGTRVIVHTTYGEAIDATYVGTDSRVKDGKRFQRTDGRGHGFTRYAREIVKLVPVR